LGAPTDGEEWTLNRARQELEVAGLITDHREEAFPTARFLDVEGIVYLLKVVSWQVPDFTVDRYFEQLRDLDAEIHPQGSVDVTTHRFLAVARKPD